MLSYKSANIDHIQSTLSPPSKYPSFNENLKVNDGILVNYIKNQNQMTLEQAKNSIADYVEQLNDLFDKKEMVDIPKVGRLTSSNTISACTKKCSSARGICGYSCHSYDRYTFEYTCIYDSNFYCRTCS